MEFNLRNDLPQLILQCNIIKSIGVLASILPLCSFILLVKQGFFYFTFDPYYLCFSFNDLQQMSLGINETIVIDRVI